VSGERDDVKRAIGLSFEGVNEGMKIDGEIVPDSFSELEAGCLDEEGLQFYFMGTSRKDNATLGLDLRVVYLVEIADGEFEAPGHAGEEVDLQHKVLLDEVEVLLVFAGELHLGVGLAELQDEG
jgi:hypothetical protein